MAVHYRELIVWQKSMGLAKEIYRLTKKMPKEEIYGLTNQIRRVAVSIPSNIAEGNARAVTGDYVRFLTIARGSIAEVDTQLSLYVMLEYLKQEEIERMLNSMITKLRNNR